MLLILNSAKIGVFHENAKHFQKKLTKDKKEVQLFTEPLDMVILCFLKLIGNDRHGSVLSAYVSTYLNGCFMSLLYGSAIDDASTE